MNEPVKGHFWLPGGRMRNGETRAAAVARLAAEELGVGPEAFEIVHVSDRSNEEIFPMHAMSDAEAALARYGPEVDTVHYWGGIAYVRAKGRPPLSLDTQSGREEWRSELDGNAHPYLRWYFETLADDGFPLLGL